MFPKVWGCEYCLFAKDLSNSVARKWLAGLIGAQCVVPSAADYLKIRYAGCVVAFDVVAAVFDTNSTATANIAEQTRFGLYVRASGRIASICEPIGRLVHNTYKGEALSPFCNQFKDISLCPWSHYCVVSSQHDSYYRYSRLLPAACPVDWQRWRGEKLRFGPKCMRMRKDSRT